MSNKVITIGIPTYNRSVYLDKCLNELLKQADEFKGLIEIQVADNASTDNTSQVVNKYKNLGSKIDYIRHDENIGMDRNFYSLYQRCSTKYMWMLSDDDFLLPGALKNIMTLVLQKEFGVLYLSNIWFNEVDEIANLATNNQLSYTEYDKPLDFVDRVNYWFTFISGNIINKDIIKNKIDLDPYDGTFLMLLGWIVPAVFQSLPSYVIENNILACKANNTGGYKLFKVFGKNFNYVMDELVKQGCDIGIKNIINNHLLDSFFPMFLNKKNEKFANEKYLSSMLPVFWKYKIFWKKIFPALLKQELNIV